MARERLRVSDDTKWEPVVGYSRAVRVGDTVRVSGTTATDDDGAIVAPDDAGRQAAVALENVESALERAGASADDVVRTRTYVEDIEDWRAVGEAHAAVFGDVRPATTLVEVSRLVDEALVEIEAEAVVDE